MKAMLPGLVKLLIFLELFLALGAFYGGGALLVAPDGSALGVPLEALEGAPFESYLIPGLLLLGFIGILPTVVAVGALRRSPWAPRGHLLVGALLFGFEVVEVAMLGLHPLQVGYGILGLAILGLGGLALKPI